MAKIRVPAMLPVIALTLCALPLISLAPVGRAGATDDPSPAMNAIADADGDLRVPADYRSMYEYLGSWASPPIKARDQSSSIRSMLHPAQSPHFGQTATSQMEPCW